MYLSHVCLNFFNNNLCSIIFESYGNKDSIIEDFVELSPELVEFFHFKEDPGTDKVASENNRVDF